MNKWVKYGLGAVVGLYVLGKLVGGGDDKPAATTPDTAAPAADAPAAAPADTEAPPATEKPAGVTKALFDQLQTGMSYDDAVAIIGPPESTMSESEIAGIKTVMYQWKGNSFASNMNAMFQDGKLVNKAQFGLK